MNKFKQQMKSLKISKNYIANRMGVSRSTVSSYLRNPNGMTVIQYRELCNILCLEFKFPPENLNSNCDSFVEKIRAAISNSRMKRIKRKLKSNGAICQILENNLTGLGILYGDYVIVDLNLKPSDSMQDLILYTTSKGPDNIGLYWGRYVNHWAKDCPKFRNASHAAIRSIEGVVTAVYNSELKLKVKYDVSRLSNILQDTSNTISVEPSNRGSGCEPNSILIYRKGKAYA